MIKKLPNYIFEKQYDNYFLLTELDIIFNYQFYYDFIEFFNESGNENLIFELERINDIEISNMFFKYKNPKVSDFEEFYETEVKLNDKNVLNHFLNHFIYGELKNWEIYISPEYEMSIFACNNQIVDKFSSIIKPYHEESFNTKVKIIGDMFTDENTRKVFFTNLFNNYFFGHFLT